MLPALILGLDNAFRAPAVQLVSVSQALYFERPTAFIMTGLESALVKHVSPPFGPAMVFAAYRGSQGNPLHGLQRGRHGECGLPQMPLRQSCAQLWGCWSEEAHSLCSVQGAWHGESVQESGSKAAPSPDSCATPHDDAPPGPHDGLAPPPDQHGPAGNACLLFPPYIGHV